MKLTLTSAAQSSLHHGQPIFIITDSAQINHVATRYAIDHLENLVESTQFQASLNDTLPLLQCIDNHCNSMLIGMGKVDELSATQVAKIAQTIIQAAQKNLSIFTLISMLSLLSYTIFSH